MEIQLSLTEQEAQAIIQVLGQLPTSSNAYPLLQKIITQVQAVKAEVQND